MFAIVLYESWFINNPSDCCCVLKAHSTDSEIKGKTLSLEMSTIWQKLLFFFENEILRKIISKREKKCFWKTVRKCTPIFVEEFNIFKIIFLQEPMQNHMIARSGHDSLEELQLQWLSVRVFDEFLMNKSDIGMFSQSTVNYFSKVQFNAFIILKQFMHFVHASVPLLLVLEFQRSIRLQIRLLTNFASIEIS